MEVDYGIIGGCDIEGGWGGALKRGLAGLNLLALGKGKERRNREPYQEQRR
jgi:hypothetical protein